MLLLLFGSTAQVAHHHAGDLPLSKSSQQKAPAPHQKDAESLCPLCIAMHSALPVAAPVAQVPVALAHEVDTALPASRYVSLWTFELFGRPPPQPARA
jgi:hypothetical protein